MPHRVELGGAEGWGRAGPPGLLGTQAQSCALQCDPPGTLWELLGFLQRHPQCKAGNLTCGFSLINPWRCPLIGILEETALHSISPTLSQV